MRSLDELTGAWEGALIRVTDGAAITWRPAAFVFDYGGGIAWVEPSYALEEGTPAPALHVFLAPRETETRWIAPGRTVSLFDYSPADDADLAGDSLEWFRGWLKTVGRTWQEERARMRDELNLQALEAG